MYVSQTKIIKTRHTWLIRSQTEIFLELILVTRYTKNVEKHKGRDEFSDDKFTFTKQTVEN